MLLATYKSIRPGLQGIGNRLIQLRLDSIYSHSELIFEPSDGVDHLMPNFTTSPNEKNEFWAASSIFAEKLPPWSKNRPNENGGVRFKLINPHNGNWDCIKLGISREERIKAAEWYIKNEGMPYDYQLIAHFSLWLLTSGEDNSYMCSESVAEALGIKDSFRYDPATLHHTLEYHSRC